MAAKISITMRRALEWAAGPGGGKLERRKGGYWMAAGNRNGPHYSVATMRALVARGLAEFTDHRTSSGGRFPVEITLTEAGRAHVR